MLDEPHIIDGEYDRSFRADAHAAPAAQAIIADNGTTVTQMYGVHKADVLHARAAAQAAVGHSHCHARHPGNAIPNLGRGAGQHAPKATTGAAATDGHQPVRGTHAQPDRIQPISSHHVNQASLTTALQVDEGLPFRDAASERRMNVQGSLSEEQAAQLGRIFLAFTGVATDAAIHDPQAVGFRDEMLGDPGGQHNVTRHIHRLIYRYNPVQRKIQQLISPEQPMVHEASYQG